MFDTVGDDRDPSGWLSSDDVWSDDVDPWQAHIAVADLPEWERPAQRTPWERLTDARNLLLSVAAQIPGFAARSDAAELIEGLRVSQQAADLLAPVTQALIAEVGPRGVQEQYGHPSVAALLVAVQHVRPAEAAARVRAAGCLTPRTTLQGETLPALREHAAAAQLTGSISADHALVIDRALRALPDHLDPGVVDTVEQALVELAARTDPTQVARAGRFAGERLDPDGAEPTDREIDRRRTVTIRPRDDGMGDLRGRITPELLAALQAVFSPLAAPRPADADGADPRSSGQRMHDALHEATDRLLRSDTLPDSGGVPISIAVIMTLRDLTTGSGLAHTEWGATIPVARLLRQCAECEYIPVVCDDAGGILSYGTVRRIAPPAMAKALRARDRGCTFPDCRRPAAWTERHHLREHRHGGETKLENLALVCRYHHRAFQHHGWTITMRHGRPWWTPPAHLDPSRTPVRNTYWDTPTA